MIKSRVVASAIFLGAVLSLNAQQKEWRAEYQKARVFIENKGQFDNACEVEIGKIKYAIDFGATKILFGERGVAYDFLEATKLSKEERAEIEAKKVNSVAEHKEKERVVGKFRFRTDHVNMQWVGASSSVKLIGEKPTSDHHSYTFTDKNGNDKNVNYIQGFKVLKYINIYPKIDIEYTVHPEIGVKYAIIVHPGANPANVKMLYDRAISLKDGAIQIPTKFGDIIDHAPLTFYSSDKNNIIPSAYKLEGKTVSFELNAYNNSKKIVIDPWVQTPIFNTNWDCVWECERDAAGNAYLIGGIMPLQLQKYNTTGVLQWTYNTPYDTSNCWLGGMATDNLGNSYVSRGSVSGIQKIDANGALVWSNNAGGGSIGSSDEYWSLSFNCDQSKLVVGGTSGAFALPPLLRATFFELNINNGNILSSQNVAVGNAGAFPLPTIQEIRSISPSPSGKYYFITQDTIGYISDQFTNNPCGTPVASLVKIDHGMSLGYKCENYREDNSGIMAIKANGAFVYVHRGNEIQKRSLGNLSIVATAPIPGGGLNSSFGVNSLSNSGIDIDDCGNVYVGSMGAVVKFDANLNQIANYPTSFNVYDLHVNSGGEIIACGSTGTSNTGTRAGYIQSIAATACTPMTLTCCDATLCPVGTFCPNDPSVNLTPFTPGGTFSGAGITNTSLGTFDPSVAGVGVHMVYYTLPCGMDSTEIVVSSCTALSPCIEPNGDLSVSGGVGPYTWYEFVPPTSTPITNQTQCEDCGYIWFPAFPPFVPSAYCADLMFNTVTSCPMPGYWAQFGTGSTVNPPTHFPIEIIDAGGASVIVNDINDLQPCSTIPCPTITVVITAQADPSCNGGNNGSATVSASGGNGAYTYVWQPGNLTGATQNALSAGTYTVTATDADNCIGTVTVTITEPTVITLSTSSAPSSCTINDGSASVLASGGAGSYTYSWSPTGGNASTANNLGPGSYTVTVLDANGCSASATVSVNTLNGPSISVSSVTDATCFGATNGSATVSASGGTGNLSYNWSPVGGNTATATGLAAGNYTVTVTDDAGCSAVITVVVGQAPEISIIPNVNAANCGSADGAISLTVSGGSGSGYSYVWQPNGEISSSISGLIPGQYTVTVTDGNNCSNSETITVPQIGNLTVTVNPVSATIEQGDEVQLTASGGSSYSWTPSTGLSCVNCPNPIANPTTTTTYTVTATDDFGCTGTASVTVFVITLCGDLFVPTIFSPNGDGNNDVQCVMGGCVESMTFAIFNRWGEKVFETNNQADCWDGTYKGKPVNTGVYVYKLNALLTNGENIVQSGNLNLVR
jgi:gliding motility-associated-like protein